MHVFRSDIALNSDFSREMLGWRLITASRFPSSHLPLTVWSTRLSCAANSASPCSAKVCTRKLPEPLGVCTLGYAEWPLEGLLDHGFPSSVFVRRKYPPPTYGINRFKCIISTEMGNEPAFLASDSPFVKSKRRDERDNHKYKHNKP